MTTVLKPSSCSLETSPSKFLVCLGVFVGGFGFFVVVLVFGFFFINTHLKVQAGTEDLHLTVSLTHPH